MQSAPPGAQSGCFGSQSSAAAPRLHGTSDGADATAADAAAVSATHRRNLFSAPLHCGRLVQQVKLMAQASMVL